MYAMHLAPGLRRRFAAERWDQIPAQVWRKERERAQDLIQKDAAFTGFGYDIDENALAIARKNAAKAGVSGKLRFERRDIRELVGSTGGSRALPGDGTEASAEKGMELHSNQPGRTV